MKQNKQTVEFPADAAQGPILKVRGLSVHYQTMDDTVYAVNDLDLEIPRGKTLGLVGETGAGKTTTGLAILRLLQTPPAVLDGGEIQYNGLDMQTLTEKQMQSIRGGRISMIFQDPMTSLKPGHDGRGADCRIDSKASGSQQKRGNGKGWGYA